MLHAAGHEAFLVGGCVRDCLMGQSPQDWDVCTAAKPAEIQACFAHAVTIHTGIAHGTVTVVSGGMPVEITTYRVEGPYSDGRHPDAVTFTDSLTEDLARRDFTMNAMAYHPAQGLVDPFGGQGAIAARQIVCVGDAAARFREDALRMLRGLRFAATLGFTIEPRTRDAMQRCAHLVHQISRERVHGELSKLLLGAFAGEVLAAQGEILMGAVPGIQPFCHDRLQPLAAVGIDALPAVAAVRLAAVFPTETEKHLTALKYSRSMTRDAAALGRLLTKEPSSARVEIKRTLCREGERITVLYYSVFGKEALVQDVLQSGECWHLKQLAVNGNDLMAVGIKPGKAVGCVLLNLLDLVIEERLENRREILLAYGRRMHENAPR